MLVLLVKWHVEMQKLLLSTILNLKYLLTKLQTILITHFRAHSVYNIINLDNTIILTVLAIFLRAGICSFVCVTSCLQKVVLCEWKLHFMSVIGVYSSAYAKAVSYHTNWEIFRIFHIRMFGEV